MSRKKFVAGNWKMCATLSGGKALAAAIAADLAGDDRVTVALFPPFPYLSAVGAAIAGTPIDLGAQNLYPKPDGAYTGEVCAAMLLDVGCKYVIVGHSERRHVLGESDAFVNEKVKSGLGAGLSVILCIGEKEAERDGHQTEAVLDRQLTLGLAGIGAANLDRLVIAYEPVWAIGTGKNAEVPQVEEAHAFIRGRFSALYGENAAQRVTLLYGGSVKPKNAAELMRPLDVDGALVGGASLQADDFLKIVRAALG